MNTLQIFDNEEFGSIRTLTIDGEPWFVGRDVALALGYSNTRDALSRHIESDDRDVVKHDSLNGGKQDTVIINESGLYCLILSSKLPSAKRFKRWITHEVLPAIRKTGSYALPDADTPQRDITRDDYIRAASIVASCRNERFPVVIKLLQRSGLDMPHLAELQEEMGKDSDRDLVGQAASRINEAVNEYGLSLRRIEKLTGISGTELGRIRTGQSRPKKARMHIICDAIQKEIERIESEA